MIKTARPKKNIVVSDSKTTRVIPTEMIIYLEACGPYSLIYSKNGEEIVWSKTLKFAHEQLDSENFVRVHKGHIVNLDEIVNYKRGRGGVVVLSNGTEIAVAFRRKVEFLQRYQRTA